VDPEAREALANVWNAIERVRSRVERLTIAVAVASVLLLGDRALSLLGL
jgi:hypothetical protein